MRDPCVVWERGSVRVLAVNREGGEQLVCEYLSRDGAGDRCWVAAEAADPIVACVVEALAAEVASRVDVGHAPWARELVARVVAAHEARARGDAEESEGAA